MSMDEGYRRGTVLGLTIAEIFILLVFLMLLALVGVSRYWSDKLSPWRDLMARFNPEQIEVALTRPEELRRQLERLNSQIGKLEKEKERLQSRIRILMNEQEMSAEKLDETRVKLRGVESVLIQYEKASRESEGKIATLVDEKDTSNEELERKNAKLREMEISLIQHEKALEESQGKIANLMKEHPLRNHSIDELRAENDDLRDKIRVIGKGITPPCWYQRVDEDSSVTGAGWRERPYYLFDIAIREDHMEIQPLPVPEGRAGDDGGKPYSREAEELRLNAIPYGIALTNRQVLDLMSPLSERGKASHVRTYSCIFYVRVWDETSEVAKDRWKQAHDGILERLFGTYQVRDTTWNGRDTVPVNVPFAGQSG